MDFRTLQPQASTIEEAHAGLVQPKLNGVRATWIPELQQLVKRNGNYVESVPHIVQAIQASDVSGLRLDGEIFSRELTFEQINGAARRQAPTDVSGQLQFHVFDVAVVSMPQLSRLRLIEHLTGPILFAVPTVQCRSQAEVAALYEQALGDGYEGVVLRNVASHYAQGRTEVALKIKPRFDIEAEVIAIDKSVTLRLADGKTFKAQMNQNQRERWDDSIVGQSMTVEYFDVSNNGLPKSAVCKDLRHDLGEVRSRVTHSVQHRRGREAASLVRKGDAATVAAPSDESLDLSGLAFNATWRKYRSRSAERRHRVWRTLRALGSKQRLRKDICVAKTKGQARPPDSGHIDQVGGRQDGAVPVQCGTQFDRPYREVGERSVRKHICSSSPADLPRAAP